jgi:MSHA biogenesis protein MshI
MSKKRTNKQKQQNWLHITNHGLTVFKTRNVAGKLPQIEIVAHQAVENPLQSAQAQVAWVSQHVKGRINLLLADSLYQLLLSDVPDVPEEEIESAIMFKAADLIQYDIEDAALDVIQLPSEAYRGRMKMAFIIATQKTYLRDWAMALIAKSIQIDIIDVEHTQLRNLALHLQNFNETGIFHIENTRGRLLLNYQGEMVLSRTFDSGLSTLLPETTVQDGELELTLPEDNQNDIQLESLVLEMRRSFDYYESQLGLGAVSEVQLLCLPEHLSLSSKLTEKLGMRFSPVNLADFMDFTSSDPAIEPTQVMAIAGTAFRGVLA